MSKYFRPWNIDQTLFLPPNVQDFVPKGHVSRFIVELVRESLDLKEITGSYVSGLGQPPFDPRMMVALLLHSYASGLYSSRRIARACRERNDFVMIVALDPPDFRTISDFRKRHLKALGALFLQVLKLCETAGLVKLGHVALDGTKIKANASKHKAMSYERMKQREAELKAEVARMLAAAEAADSEEDKTFGKDKRGDEMPDWAGDSRSDWRRSSRRWRRWRPTLGWLRRKSAASRPKKNSSGKPKAARSRANRRHRRRTSPIPNRSATSPIRKAAS
jgi:transposase